MWGQALNLATPQVLITQGPDVILRQAEQCGIIFIRTQKPAPIA